MYQSINLMIYAENNTNPQKLIQSIVASHNIPFKELRSLGLVFSAIKNPSTYLILLIKTRQLLESIKSISKNCPDCQSRIFIIYDSENNIDPFFENFCLNSNLDKVNQFITNISQSKQIFSPRQPSKLLSKLVELELQNLDVSKKYIGFKYLIELIVNAISTQCFSSNYIDLFEYVAILNLASIDTVERDVRHMLVTTWKTSVKFKHILQKFLPNSENPNSKRILNAIINYIKNAI